MPIEGARARPLVECVSGLWTRPRPLRATDAPERVVRLLGLGQGSSSQVLSATAIVCVRVRAPRYPDAAEVASAGEFGLSDVFTAARASTANTGLAGLFWESGVGMGSFLKEGLNNRDDC